MGVDKTRFYKQFKKIVNVIVVLRVATIKACSRGANFVLINAVVRIGLHYNRFKK